MKEILDDLLTWLRAPPPQPPPPYRLDRSMSYQRYATASGQLNVWPDRLIEALRMPRALAVVTCATAFLTAGALIALPYGFLGHYLSTPAVYVGCGGFALVVATIHWASVRFHPAYEHLRPIFTVRDEDYRRIIDKWTTRASRDRYSLAYSLVIYLLFMSAVGASMLLPAEFRNRYHLTFGTTFLTANWYLPEFRIPVVAVLGVLGAFVSLALGTAVRLLTMNLGFLFELRRLPVLPLPNLVRARLRPMIDLYIGVSLLWSLGVGLYGILFYRTYSLFSGLFILSLFLLGVLTFGVPQLVCRRFITNSYTRLSAISLAWLYERLGIQLQEREQPEIRPPALVADNLVDLSQLTEKPKTWVYDSQDLFVWITSQAIAFSAIFAQGLVARLTS
jgi:hypothetical protein